MSKVLQKGLRYWNTLRYLKPVQIIGRIQHRLKRVKVDLSEYQGKNALSNNWVQPARRDRRMVEENNFCFLNECHEIITKEDWNNNEWSKLWLYNLHYFDDLNAMDADQRTGWHRDLIQRWSDENPPGKGNGWEPYPSSLRIVNWIKWTLAGNQLDKVSEHSLVVQIRYLSRNLETHLMGNHLFANAKALLFAGLFFYGKEAKYWYRTGLKIVERELPEQVFSDGGNFEQSTMYHAIFLEDLLDLVNVHRTFSYDLPKVVESTIRGMIDWLVAMCHPDGEISFFNDSALGVASSVVELLSYAERLGFSRPQTISGLTDFSESGYSRVAVGDAVILVDRAAVGPDYLPGHCHADTLSFELSLFGQRVVVNSGTSVYEAGPERQRQRGTAAHSTVVIDGQDSSEVWGEFRVAQRAKVNLRKNALRNNGIYLSACHDGYRRLAGKLFHCREWSVKKNLLEIQDRINGHGTHNIDVILPLHPDIKVNDISESQAFLDSGGNTVEIEFYGTGSLSLEKTTYHPEFGLSIKNNRLIFKFVGQVPTEIKTRIRW